MIPEPIFSKQEQEDHARKWLDQSPATGFLEIKIEGDKITLSISQEADDVLKHLSEQGIEYEPPVLVLCG
jgi:hypothetical protein